MDAIKFMKMFVFLDGQQAVKDGDFLISVLLESSDME